MNEVWKKPPISLEAYQNMVGHEVGVSSWHLVDQNRIDVPDFGSIVFGEIWIRQASRRLTMVRVDLGSPGPAAPAALKRRAGMKRRVLKGPKGGGGGSKNGTGRLIGLDIDPNGGGFPPFFKRL